MRTALLGLVLAATCAAQISNNATRLRGRVISPTAPTDGQALVYNATTARWEPGTASGGAPGGAAGGDLAGTYPNPTIKVSVALTTPNIGVATATTVNGLTITGSTGTFTLTDAKTLSVSNTLTLAGTDGTTMTFPAASGAVQTADSTAVLTNKTYDASATGNAFTSEVLVEYVAAVCQGASPSLALSSPATNPAVAACVAGTNTTYGVADFDDTTSESLQAVFQLPSDWTSTISADIMWHAAATTGNVVWGIAAVCAASNEGLDPAFNAAATVTDGAQAVANRLKISTLNLTTTGCAANERLFLQILRDAGAGGDTMTGDVRLISFRLHLKRTQ